MADPRFYDNQGPFPLSAVCAHAKIECPTGGDGNASVADVAMLEDAGALDLSFCVGKPATAALAATRAGFCFLNADAGLAAPQHTVSLPCASASHAFARALALFYPDSGIEYWAQTSAIHPDAEIGANVALAPGVVIGPGVEIGDRSRIGPNAVIGRGVAIGQDCEIGANVSISHAYIGDGVTVLPGANIGQPGFGFASGASGHLKIPQIGRVIIQDKVEIGSGTTIDRGALGDTVIGEGTKIDNLVQVGHNTHIGRHCMIVAQVGISGSCDIGDFVVMGGQAGIADHARIGDSARLAARTGVMPGTLEGGRDYGGVPAVPVQEWRRQMVAMFKLGRAKKQNGDG